MVHSLEEDKPKTIKEALSSSSSDKWKQTMEEEKK